MDHPHGAVCGTDTRGFEEHSFFVALDGYDNDDECTSTTSLARSLTYLLCPRRRTVVEFYSAIENGPI